MKTSKEYKDLPKQQTFMSQVMPVFMRYVRKTILILHLNLKKKNMKICWIVVVAPVQ